MHSWFDRVVFGSLYQAHGKQWRRAARLVAIYHPFVCWCAYFCCLGINHKPTLVKNHPRYKIRGMKIAALVVLTDDGMMAASSFPGSYHCYIANKGRFISHAAI